MKWPIEVRIPRLWHDNGETYGWAVYELWEDNEIWSGNHKIGQWTILNGRVYVPARNGLGNVDELEYHATVAYTAALARLILEEP